VIVRHLESHCEQERAAKRAPDRAIIARSIERMNGTVERNFTTPSDSVTFVNQKSTNLMLIVALIMIWLAPLPARATPSSLPAITSESQFNALARTVNAGRHAAFPQVMFIVDRGAGGKATKLYFVNSKRYPFHIDYIQKATLSTQSLEELYRVSYFEPNRRFILGSVVRYPALDRYGIEFWEGDQLDKTLLMTALTALQAAFPRPLAFKPNSQPQFDLAASLPGLETIDGNLLYGSRDALVLNAGKAVGRLRILPRITPQTVLNPGDILILDESPLTLSPVAGIITTEFSTPLAHVNLLAKSWRVPNGYLRGAGKTYAALEGQMVAMLARGDAISLRAATAKEIANAATVSATRTVQIARADMAFRAFPALAEQQRRDVIRTGAKAANLGDVARHAAKARSPGFIVPAGFSIPFAYYGDFVRNNGLDRKIEAFLANPATLNDPLWRKRALADLRAAFVAAPFDPALLAAIAQRRAEVIGEGGVFARSSTNSEDLKGFNGAGLYTSVPNVTSTEALATAIKTVWASVWNETAFDARMAAGIDHRSVMASVLIQRGMNAEAAGVMITENPFDQSEKGAIFINAKRGLGIRVVEGRKVAEQLLYRSDPESIQLLTRSTDDAMLRFDENGGVREIPVEPGHAVLTDALARRLAVVGKTIDGWFGGAAQDIEWVAIGDALFIVQSRPYLRGN
jgi:rifampicin phosphotransferase